MVVDDLDIFWTTRSPGERDAELIVDPDAVLSVSITLQSLEPVCRRNCQETDVIDRVQLLQLPPGDAPNLPRADAPDGA